MLTYAWHAGGAGRAHAIAVLLPTYAALGYSGAPFFRAVAAATVLVERGALSLADITSILSGLAKSCDFLDPSSRPALSSHLAAEALRYFTSPNQSVTPPPLTHTPTTTRPITPATPTRTHPSSPLSSAERDTPPPSSFSTSVALDPTGAGGGDAQAAELKPVQLKPVELKPVELKPVKLKPVELKPVELKPVELKPSISEAAATLHALVRLGCVDVGVFSSFSEYLRSLDASAVAPLASTGVLACATYADVC
jgi:hypothetical protein